MSSANDQLQSIHAMLASGHRSLHLERHTLLLIGSVGGFVSIATEWIITAERFPDSTQRALALLAWLAFWFGGVSWLDHRLTRRERQRRDETLPFAQAQITRAWWTLLAVGTLASFAMLFYGGTVMIYALWIVLTGLGIYLFGLFSRPLTEWIGLATILLGVAALAAGLPFNVTRWLCASTFLIGLPLAGYLAQRVDDGRIVRRTLALIAWIAAVVAVPLMLARMPLTPEPAARPVTLGENALPDSGEYVLHVPAGTRLGLAIDLESTILRTSDNSARPLVLTLPVELAMTDGSPDGRYRIGTSAWHTVHDGVLSLAIDRISTGLDSGVPTVRIHVRFGLRELDTE